MNAEKLKKRFMFVSGTTPRLTAAPLHLRNRGLNHVEMDEEELGSKFDNFFDYEKEISDFKPAHILAEQMTQDITDAVILVPEEHIQDKESIIISVPIDFEPIIDESINNADTILNEIKSEQTDILKFSFIQCQFIKLTGERCKRQAPNDMTMCSVHRKQVENKSINN